MRTRASSVLCPPFDEVVKRPRIRGRPAPVSANALVTSSPSAFDRPRFRPPRAVEAHSIWRGFVQRQLGGRIPLDPFFRSRAAGPGSKPGHPRSPPDPLSYSPVPFEHSALGTSGAERILRTLSAWFLLKTLWRRADRGSPRARRRTGGSAFPDGGPLRIPGAV